MTADISDGTGTRQSERQETMKDNWLASVSMEKEIACIFALIAVLATFIRSCHHRVGAPPASSTRRYAYRGLFGIPVCFRQLHIDRIALQYPR